MPRKRPKSLDSPIVVQARRLEAWAYLRCDQWKKQYRYTLVNEFRSHITEAKNEIIRAFELSNKFKKEKVFPKRKFVCVFSDELLENRGCPPDDDEMPSMFNKPHTNGSLAHITAIFGFMLAGLVVQDIAKNA